jgi:UDP-N-acetylmuramoyl-tripeptide--D-alanyl-D-alanine ligase
MTTEQLYAIYKQYPSIQTDTRKIKEDDIFFALKGEHFDGHHFIKEAFENGAAYAVIDDPACAEFAKTILVPNVLTALQELAGHHRKQFTIPFLAITGSNGKTTTKELVHAVLSNSYKTYTTEGNLNNHIGIPLTLLKIRDDAQVAVVEMGANHPGEIASYCAYTMPTHGLITNCGRAHLEGFGSEEGVRKAKGELFDHIRMHDGTVFIMQDYPYLQEMSQGIPVVITYGTFNAELEGNIIKNEDLLTVSITKGANIPTLRTNLVGDYNLPNVLAAVAIGKFFNVADDSIREAIENYKPSNSRSQLVRFGTNKMIMDAYNANPSSMKSAIENFAAMQGDNKILLLGAMAELGDDSVKEHEVLLDIVRNYTWKQVVLVGGDFLHVDHSYTQFENADTAAHWFRDQQFENTLFLLKGSRSIHMEKIFEAVKQEL